MKDIEHYQEQAVVKARELYSKGFTKAKLVDIIGETEGKYEYFAAKADLLKSEVEDLTNRVKGLQNQIKDLKYAPEMKFAEAAKALFSSEYGKILDKLQMQSKNIDERLDRLESFQEDIEYPKDGSYPGY